MSVWHEILDLKVQHRVAAVRRDWSFATEVALTLALIAGVVLLVAMLGQM